MIHFFCRKRCIYLIASCISGPLCILCIAMLAYHLVKECVCVFPYLRILIEAPCIKHGLRVVGPYF